MSENPTDHRPIYGLGRLAKLTPPNNDHSYFDSDQPFAPRPGKLDLHTAWWLAEAAMLAYSDGALVQAQYQNADFDLLPPYLASGTEGYVAYNDRDVIVSFRGTEFILFREWLEDFKFLPVTWENGGKVHFGFRRAFRNIWQSTSLPADLEELRDDGRQRRFWFTGHSLGGAIATLAAGRFFANSQNYRQNEFIGLYTFGCPRVGNRRFRDAYPITSAYRFEHNRDIVARIPPWWLFWYRHIGKRFYINRLGQLHRQPGRIYRLGDRILGPFAARREDENNRYFLTLLIYIFFEPLLDHSPIHYPNRIRNLMVDTPQD